MRGLAVNGLWLHGGVQQMTNLDMIQRVLKCNDLHAQKVYRCMILGGYNFDDALMVDFTKAVELIDKNLREKLDGKDEGLAKVR